ncbi:MAG: indolepyruvate ferredoxin oxidoreductase subunit alpha [Candidatus Aenigmarchaeota archaeon]|nr:indolepyruvate ferredoxin oxidoreductase subunit alpha [Candidatus Aenigmarchaeota archaeon]
MHKVLEKQGKKVLLLGNEAIARGALEAGIGFASTYPGTPSSEIGITLAQIAKDAGIYFEYSSNEKVAFEAAVGAALSGVRSLTFFKHFGLNVACESVFPSAYTGVKAGMVIVVADDPACHSSGQSEEDIRPFARVAHLPMLEPSNAQESKDFVKEAFKLSERFKIPVFIRMTTRVDHMRSVVKLGKIVKGKTRGKFIKDIVYRNFPPYIMETHEELHKKLDKLKEVSEKSKLNFYVNKNIKSGFGIIVSGVSFDYVMDAMNDLKIKVPVLKIGFTYPLPEKLIKSFIKRFKKILIVEELEPIIENYVKRLAKDFNPKLKVLGKPDYFPYSGEYNEEMLVNTLSKITGKKYEVDLRAHKKKYMKIKEPKRLPVMCPGCPHRATFYAAKVATRGMDVVYGGDVGCYILGLFKPMETQDWMFSMGASEGVAHGIRKVSDQKVIAFLGDSTFFHAGMPGMVNAVYNKSNPLIIVMDNRITAMTGHEPNPGTGITAMGEPTKEIAIDAIAKGMGIEDVRVIDPNNVNLMIKTIRELIEKDKVSVIVAKRECQLLAMRKKRKQGIKVAKFEIDPKVCKKCGTCLHLLACPAIHEKHEIFNIDKNICTGCAVCAQICPNKAIHAVKEK